MGWSVWWSINSDTCTHTIYHSFSFAAIYLYPFSYINTAIFWLIFTSHWPIIHTLTLINSDLPYDMSHDLFWFIIYSDLHSLRPTIHYDPSCFVRHHLTHHLFWILNHKIIMTRYLFILHENMGFIRSNYWYCIPFPY